MDSPRHMPISSDRYIKEDSMHTRGATSDLNQTQFEFAKWRWEFLRRNEEFKKDHKRAVNLSGKTEKGGKSAFNEELALMELMLYGENDHFKFPSPTLSSITEKITEMSRKWELNIPIHFLTPSLSLDEIVNYQESLPLDLYPLARQMDLKNWRKSLLPGALLPRVVKIVTETHGPRFTKPKQNILVLEIDLNKFNSFTSLTQEVKNHLIAFDIIRQAKLGTTPLNMNLKELKRKPKMYLGEFEIVVMVGDMKEKDGLTNEKITEKIDPRKYRENPESAIRNVSHLYKRYKHLVNGGYREITYP